MGSGLGDGFYSSLWGLGADGEPVVLAIDFNLMRRPIWHTARIPLPLKRGALHHEVFELAGARVSVPLLPLFGKRRLRVRDGIPRVRVMDGERVVAHPPRTFDGPDPVYELGKLQGTHLEIAFSRGYEAVSPLAG